MATAKKASSGKSTKKPAASTTKSAKTSKQPIKRVVSTKKTAPVKKSPAKTSRKKVAKMESFQVYKDDSPFMATRITSQTIYWAILSAVVLILGLWVIDMSDQINRIQDHIDQSLVEQQELDEREISLIKQKKK